MRILYFHPWGIGDFLFVTNHLKIIENNYSSDILILVNNNSTKIFIEQTYHYNCINIRNNFFKIILYLISNKFDYFIPHFGINIYKLIFIKFFIRSNKSINILNYYKISRDYSLAHRINSNAHIFKFFFNNLDFPFKYHIEHPKDINKSNKIIIFFGSDKNQKYKRWPLDNWVKLVDALSNDYEVSMILGPDELLFKNYFTDSKIEFLINLDFQNLIKKISEATLLISSDSGIAHLTSALNIKSIILFGPSDPNIYGPINNTVSIIKKEFQCMPCISTNGCFGCKYSHCMNAISVNDVLRVVSNEV